MDGATEAGQRPADDPLGDLAERFRARWQTNGPAELDAFLPAPGDSLRSSVLDALVRIDLEMRWRRREAITLEDYAERYPELAPGGDWSAELLYEEYRVRHQYGDFPSLPTYEKRFPRQFEQLRRLVAANPVGTLLASLPPPPRPGARASAPPPPSAAATPALPQAVPAPEAPVKTSLHAAVPEPQPPPPGLQTPTPGPPPNSDYRLDKLIGRGGFGEVWRALAPGGLSVAVKIIDRPADHEARVREERALDVIKQLKHHFLIQTHAYWAAADRLFIVMDLAEGSLRDRLVACRKAGQRGVPHDELLSYFREASEALDYLHAKGVLHRDIKPDNLLLVEGHMRLADFGLARSQTQLLVSVSGSGTPAYMAPEMWRGHAGHASDQYSLAYSYAELRLGRRPFQQQRLRGGHVRPPRTHPRPGRIAPAGKGGPAQGPGQEARRPLPDLQRLRPRPGGGRRPLARRAAHLAALGARPPDRAGDAHRDGQRRRPAPHPGRVRTRPREHDQAYSVPRLPASAPATAALGLAAVLLLLPAAAAAALVAALMWQNRVRPTQSAPAPELTLEVPKHLSVQQGTQVLLEVKAKRTHFDGSFRLHCTASAGVHAPDVEVAAGESQAQLSVRADTDAAREGAFLDVTADGEKVHDQAHVALEVLPTTAPPPSVWLPTNGKDAGRGTEKDGKGREFYKEIIVTMPDAPPVRFVLIPQQPQNDLPTYYVMKYKVSNDLMAAWWAKQGRQPPWPATDRLPALKVTWADAADMARWLGGSLPTLKQWDKAAALDLQPQPPRDAAVRRRATGPRPVDQGDADLSPLGVGDMLGNGTEFTRDPPVKEDGPQARNLVILRGQRWTAAEALTLKALQEQQHDLPQVQFADRGSPFTGFRVVLEPPPAP